jgi:hypothetical protein
MTWEYENTRKESGRIDFGWDILHSGGSEGSASLMRDFRFPLPVSVSHGALTKYVAESTSVFLQIFNLTCDIVFIPADHLESNYNTQMESVSNIRLELLSVVDNVIKRDE